ncbi:MAG: ArsR family transcriptional regulator [Thermoplasmatales archaeon]|nr:ArsR family transcriptional regulator [Thermoplasmatales archaeon]
MQPSGGPNNGFNIEDRDIRRLFQYLFLYSRGGALRSRIVLILRERPRNKNELSNMLGVNYRTVEHHLSVLLKNKVVDGDFRKYNSLFYLNGRMSGYIEESLETLEMVGGSR